MSTPTADDLFRQGMDQLPPWNYQGDDADARFEQGLTTIRTAAVAGSLEAADYLASGGPTYEERMHWCRLLADTGDFGALSGHLTNSDHADMGAAVLAAARKGEPWAMTAMGYAYGMGMQDSDGVEAATVEGSFGWMAAVADPEAEARRYTELAAAAGFGPAHLRMVDRFGVDDTAEALAHVEAALAWGPLHPVIRPRAEELRADLLDQLGVDPAQRLAERERQAAEGNVAAQVWLASRLVDGADGVTPDPVRARALYAQAAAQADVAALRELGRMCEDGVGGPVDLDAARHHYEQAAEFGADTHARTRLAERWGLSWYAIDPTDPDDPANQASS